MESIDKIKRRIASVKTTSVITSAMKLVATAKMKYTMNRFRNISPFVQDFYSIVEDLATSNEVDNKLSTKSNSTLWIIITSSLGLCGGFNNNICKHLLKLIKPEDKIFVVGRKGRSYLKALGLANHIIQTVEFADSNFVYLTLLPTSEFILQEFKDGKFSKINLVYSKYVNSLTFNPIDIQLLPIDKKMFAKPDNSSKFVNLDESKKEVLYEPNKTQILDSCLSTYVTTLLYASIVESKLCENSSRRNAMETATNNAKELIDKLTLRYNRVRQQNITSEINEIVAGAGSSDD